MNIPKDPNAVLAFGQTCEYLYEKVWGYGKGSYKKAPQDHKDRAEREVKGSRLKHFLEQGEHKVKEQNGTFVCEENYAFVNVVEECEHYRIYRCDGGHHFGVVFIEHKEREGAQGNSRRLVLKNGQYVMEEGQERQHDSMELD